MLKIHIPTTIFFCLLFVFLSSIFNKEAKAQASQSDSLLLLAPKKQNPAKAALLSAIVPGAGQIYNKKYWKIPLLYAGIGSFVYMIGDFNKKYKYYKEAYANAESPGPSHFYEDKRYAGYSAQDKKKLFEKYKDNFRRYRDLNAILLVAFYFLNIIDASVDAHFMNFDISPNLAGEIRPAAIQLDKQFYRQNCIGISYSVRF